MHLISLNTSAGGMPKTPVLFARVTRAGVEGDRQRNLKYHGGADRAVCLYSEELYAWLRASGIDLASGSLGENFTTRGVDLLALAPADRLQVGGCLIEITNVRVPCRQLNRWDPRLHKLIEGRSGWVARVIEEAVVRPGDPIMLVRADASHP